jgi:hypothetical protein
MNNWAGQDRTEQDRTVHSMAVWGRMGHDMKLKCDKALLKKTTQDRTGQTGQTGQDRAGGRNTSGKDRKGGDNMDMTRCYPVTPYLFLYLNLLLLSKEGSGEQRSTTMHCSTQHMIG